MRAARRRAMRSRSGRTVPGRGGRPGPRAIPAAVEATAYFVIAEALTNVARYAGAPGVRVQVAEAGEQLDGQRRPTTGAAAPTRARVGPPGAARPRGGGRRVAGRGQPAGRRDVPHRDAAGRLTTMAACRARRPRRRRVLLREALAASLAAAGFEVVGQAGDVAGLLELVDRELPDVRVLDVRMPPTFTTEGLEAAKELRRRHGRASRSSCCRSTSRHATRWTPPGGPRRASATCSRIG